MNFEILKQAETQFREIADFYVNWNAEPENIISYLMEHPSTKRLMDNNVKVREQFALQKIKKEGGISGPSMDFKLANGQWLGVKMKQVLPEHYKLSGRDVWKYIYVARIVPRDEGITAFCNELDAISNEAEERGQIRWCRKFRSLLNALSDQLTTFDSMPLRSRPKPDGYKEWSESYGNVRWYDIDQTLHDLANNHIRPLIDHYQRIINDCLINLPEHQPAANEQVKTTENVIQQEYCQVESLFSDISTTLTPPPADQPARNTIYILPDARPALIADLRPYIDHSQYESLQNLINEGTEPEQPIICQCEQVRIGEIFYERVKAPAKRNRQIQTEKTKIVRWICQHFRRIEFEQVKPPTESVIGNYLKGKGFAQYR